MTTNVILRIRGKPRTASKAFMAEIRGDFADVFALLAGPPDVTCADER